MLTPECIALLVSYIKLTCHEFSPGVGCPGLNGLKFRRVLSTQNTMLRQGLLEFSLQVPLARHGSLCELRGCGQLRPCGSQLLLQAGAQRRLLLGEAAVLRAELLNGTLRNRRGCQDRLELCPRVLQLALRLPQLRPLGGLHGACARAQRLLQPPLQGSALGGCGVGGGPALGDRHVGRCAGRAHGPLQLLAQGGLPVSPVLELRMLLLRTRPGGMQFHERSLQAPIGAQQLVILAPQLRLRRPQSVLRLLQFLRLERMQLLLLGFQSCLQRPRGCHGGDARRRGAEAA
mmetsp:Transcript_71154/g.230294  ORF Transcript_71154/g.230294 Transcript_71154/m.230294 type:complete len:289 (+) Transcript_71154:264-1130(+)